MENKILQVTVDEAGGIDIQVQNFSLIELLGICDTLKMKYEKDFKEHVLGNEKKSQPLIVKKDNVKAIN